MTSRWFWFVSVLIVFAVSVSAGDLYQHNHHSHSHHSHSHAHQNQDPIEVTRPVPEIRLTLKTKQDETRILLLETRHFDFTAGDHGNNHRSQKSSGDIRGHAYLSVNGESFAMFYEPRYVLPPFAPGEYTLKVTLNSRSHAPLAHNGTIISDTIVLSVAEPSE